MKSFLKIDVKKLVSLSPDKYKIIPIIEAIKDYGMYCCIIGQISQRKHKVIDFKTFDEWLKTEI